MTTLRVENLTVRFGGLAAVHDFSFETKENEILSIIGPNGAGKTTLFNAITGYIQPSEGNVSFGNRVLTDEAIHAISEIGVIRTFQKKSFFPHLTVVENVLLGEHMGIRPSLIDFIKPGNMKKKELSGLRRALELLEFVGLSEKKDMMAAELPYGEQRLLGICIALAANPKILLLDEPCAGSNPNECENMVGLIRKINADGVPIVLVEHHMRVVMGLSDRIIVLNSGEKMAEGTPAEITCNEDVICAYLGKSGENDARNG